MYPSDTSIVSVSGYWHILFVSFTIARYNNLVNVMRISSLTFTRIYTFVGTYATLKVRIFCLDNNALPLDVRFVNNKSWHKKSHVILHATVHYTRFQFWKKIAYHNSLSLKILGQGRILTRTCYFIIKSVSINLSRFFLFHRRY